MSDIQFVDGLLVKAPRDNAPDFVKGSISIKRAELIATLTGMSGDWINLDIKESKGGKWYASVNDWKPEGQAGSVPQSVAQPEIDGSSIPF